MNRSHYRLILPLTLISTTVSVLIAQMILSSCGESGSSADSFTSLPEGYSTLEGRTAATLSEDQAMALEAVMESRRQVKNRSGYWQNASLTGMKGDGTMLCSTDGQVLSGKIKTEQGHAQSSTTRVDETKMKSDVSADFDVTYVSCQQETMPTVNGIHPLFALDGKLHAANSTSAQTSHDSGSDKLTGSGVAIDTLNGTIQANGSAVHTIVLSDFSVANRWSRELYNQYKVITADPLGGEQARAGKLDFWSKIIGCKGSITIDGQDYACTAVARQLLERAVNRD